MMKLSYQMRLLPLLVLVASISLIIRVGDVALGFKQSGVAFAQQEVDVEPPSLPMFGKEESEEPEPADKDTQMADKEMASDDSMDKSEEELSEEPMDMEGEVIDWQDASESEFEYSEVRAELFKDLVARREALESRERTLATREALLEAAERELDQKIREMTAVRNEIEGLLLQQSEEEQARVQSLVKIYEGMKAKDAARIFNTLDIDILLSVVSRMSERKSGAILAEMTPDRARAVTTLLAQQKQIPSIPAQ